MSTEATRRTIITAGAINRTKPGIEAAGWSVYFGKGEAHNHAGHVSNGPQDQDNADITAVIHAIRLLRKQHVEGTYFRIVTDNEKVVEAATQTGGSGHARTLEDELEMAKKAGFDILVDKLLGDERSKGHDEAMEMAEHAALTQNVH